MRKCESCGQQHSAKRLYLCERCYSKNRYHTNPEYRKANLEATRKWQKAHPERNREINNKAVKAWTERNKEQVKEYNRQKYQKNKEYYKEYARKKYLCKKNNQ
jgi:hypothetical protein